MVIRIKTGRSIKGVLNYNEQKVQKGVAEIVLASGFSTEVEEMTFSQKLRRFEQLIQRKEKTKTNAVHISLNFPPEENPNTETLQKIATDYMQRIGFGEQPYVVYQHHDANHSHIHIVTTSIRVKGKPINLHNLAKLKSEPARKALEQEYGLIQAESRKRIDPFTPTPVNPQAATYGLSETKATISNIVREVTANYKFTCLEELNAILRQYNVTAYRGAVGSRQYVNRGLSYSMVDRDGYKIGVPIKASSIYTSPTLNNLEKKFERNKLKKIPYKKFVQGKLDSVVTRSSTLEGLIGGLQQKNIQCHFERSEKGEIRSIYFIDPFNRTIYEAGELGYTLESLFSNLKYRKASKTPDTSLKDLATLERFKMDISLEIVKSLLATEQSGPDLDPGFSKKKRKKKRKPR